MKKALIVGIDFYQYGPPLHGCVNDAYSMKSALERNSDGTVNFDVMLLASVGSNDPVTRGELRTKIQDLFKGSPDIALLYFAGHGHLESTGGYILASDSATGDDGVPLNDIMIYANESKARNKIIVLDSCHSGIAGNKSGGVTNAELSDGITIMTASSAEQYASEENGQGVFTTLFVDALNGAAANLLGDVTPGGVYAHIDQSLGQWQQRPIFKTNVERFVSLRKTQPPIALVDLQALPSLFPEPGFEFQLDPTFEPLRSGIELGVPEPIPENCIKFSLLQKYNRLNLVIPVDAPHMWHAAMESKSCKLTALGEHYRKLAAKGAI